MTSTKHKPFSRYLTVAVCEQLLATVSNLAHKEGKQVKTADAACEEEEEGGENRKRKRRWRREQSERKKAMLLNPACFQVPHFSSWLREIKINISGPTGSRSAEQDESLKAAGFRSGRSGLEASPAGIREGFC